MRFAHFADMHLGYQKSSTLQNLERDALCNAVEQCIRRQVDFVVLCGDIFHTSVPPMTVQMMAIEAFRRLHEAGIPIYAIYGSHDFSPVSRSAIDLVEAAGFLTKAVVVQDRDDDDLIHLGFIQDEKTGAMLVGLPGLKAGRDITYYETLDRDSLEATDGFKIFMFHGALSELTGGDVIGESMPLSLLPRGFNYYAGGHMHHFTHDTSHEGYDHVVYPGTLFAGHHADMEESARGTRRGFVVADFDDGGITGVELVPVLDCGYGMIAVDGQNRTSESVNTEMLQKAARLDPQNQIVVVRLYGQMSGGRTTDIDVQAMRRDLIERGAIDVLVGRRSLTSAQYVVKGEPGSTIHDIEQMTFRQNIDAVTVPQESLRGSDGARLASGLLDAMRQPRPDNEKAIDYEERITQDAMARLGL